MLSGRRNLLTGEERIMALINSLEENRGRKELPLQLRQIVTNYNTVFAVEDSELTQTSLVEDEIDTEMPNQSGKRLAMYFRCS